MCRLYGFRSNLPTRVECSLVRGQNALLAQSRRDRRGQANPDGWGIALYAEPGSLPTIERRSNAAFADLRFSELAARTPACTVLAHVRHASVGGPALENTHPFACGRWTLAHNGTVTPFERMGPRLTAETAPRFLLSRRGGTDSELLFLWLLSRIERGGFDPDLPCGDPQRLSDLVGASVAELSALCQSEGSPQPPALNLVLTDGEILIAVRWNAPLYWLTREGGLGCEICGTSHAPAGAGGPLFRAVVVASEPICRGDWNELPEHSVLSTDGRLQPLLQSPEHDPAGRTLDKESE